MPNYGYKERIIQWLDTLEPGSLITLSDAAQQAPGVSRATVSAIMAQLAVMNVGLERLPGTFGAFRWNGSENRLSTARDASSNGGAAPGTPADVLTLSVVRRDNRGVPTVALDKSGNFFRLTKVDL